MRVEAAPYVFRHEDRRQRFEDRRAPDEDRRADPERHTSRASHASQPWITPAFGAHLLGQLAPERAGAATIRRAYLQPEAKTPLRPSCEEEA
jgi:hypothetical protein